MVRRWLGVVTVAARARSQRAVERCAGRSEPAHRLLSDPRRAEGSTSLTDATIAEELYSTPCDMFGNQGYTLLDTHTTPVKLNAPQPP